MTSEQMSEPAHAVHPVHALTTFELSTYRRQLENAVKSLGDAPVVGELQERLDAVLAEERSRASIADA